MVVYEHVQVVHAQSDEFITFLNQMSLEGWEMISCVAGMATPSRLAVGQQPMPAWICVLRRPVTSNGKPPEPQPEPVDEQRRLVLSDPDGR